MIRFTATPTDTSTPNVSVDVPYPTYGYSVQLHRAISIQRFKNRVGIFDNGIEFDYRTCEFQLLLTNTQVVALSALFRNNRYMLEVVRMALLGRGFFPAGPDMGDTGTFSVSLANSQSFSAMRTDYFGMFDCKLHLLFHGLHVPPHIKEPKEAFGVYDFGDVEGLRDPERDPAQEYGTTHSVSAGGGYSYVKVPTDEYVSTITQKTTTAKMAELMSYVQSVRGNPINIRARKNYWLFGPDNGEDGDTYVNMLDNTMTVVHENLDTWKTTLQLWKVVGGAA